MATKTVCDFCGDDIRKDEQYKLALNKTDGNITLEFTDVDLCGYCAGRVRDLKGRKLQKATDNR